MSKGPWSPSPIWMSFMFKFYEGGQWESIHICTFIPERSSATRRRKWRKFPFSRYIYIKTLRYKIAWRRWLVSILRPYYHPSLWYGEWTLKGSKIPHPEYFCIGIYNTKYFEWLFHLTHINTSITFKLPQELGPFLVKEQIGMWQVIKNSFREAL